MNGEIEKMVNKVSCYEDNKYHKALTKVLSLENCPKSNFVFEQLENYFRKRPVWNENTIRECILWASCSPKGYNFIRDRKLIAI